MSALAMSEKRSSLGGLHVLLGVTGGIAAHKAVDLASNLTAAGAKVNTVMTESACRLVCPKSFEAVTASAVFTSLWEDRPVYSVWDEGAESGRPRHVDLADGADIVVVAPATANIIGKVANGICDDLLSTVLCVASAKPVLLAPAMNNNMWANAAVQRNVQTVKEMGFELVGPVRGRLACGTEGWGRMSEPEDIMEAIGGIASRIKGKE
jgi:phosphopantothenoylcysteine synthetase/decarboxylase